MEVSFQTFAIIKIVNFLNEVAEIFIFIMLPINWWNIWKKTLEFGQHFQTADLIPHFLW